MNNEEPYRDQAERLKQRIEKINEKVEDKEVLPPREHIHRQKKKKTKWKLKYPLIRLLVLFFILLPVIIFSVISYRDGAKKTNGVEKTSEESVGYETINLEKSKDDEETIENSDETKEAIVESNNSDESSEQSNDDVEQTEKTVDTSVQPDSTNENKIDSQVSDINSQKEKEAGTSGPSTETEASKISSHTVKPNENLYRIAMMYYHNPKGMDIIMEANHLTSKQINAGQVLKIPLNN
jgi:cytoskeletal protein RodZ